MFTAREIRQSVDSQREFVQKLFDDLAKNTSGERGIFRDTYGAGENFAHDYFATCSQEMGLEVATDFAGNTYATWPGEDRSLPRIIIGSHLDSIPEGGNFDGAAGVIAGLVATVALQSVGLKPICDIQTMGIRAEESAWFQISYIGSRSALGTLPVHALDAKRVDTKRSLAEHIQECGGHPEYIRRGEQYIEPNSVRAFLEIHIEQAPSLVEADLPVAICTSVPGNFRYSHVRIHGDHAHVGLPRRFRRDAAMAAVDFTHELDLVWQEYEDAGKPMACTLGRFHTDADFHGLTIVPGLFHFSLDVRAYNEQQLEEVEKRVLEIVHKVEKKRGVTFDMGTRASAAVGVADSDIRKEMLAGAAALEIPTKSLGSPASHDAAAFAEAGIKMAMMFVRNTNGSHNPDEAMEIDDFLAAVSILAFWLAQHACVPTGDEKPLSRVE